MNDATRPTLRDFCKRYSAEHPESKSKRGGAKQMYLAALRAGYECSESAIHSIRYEKGLGTKYVKMQKAAQKRQAKASGTATASGAGATAREGVRKRRRTKYVSAAAAMAAKLAARRVRRQIAAEQANGHTNGKANGHANGKTEEPATAVIATKATSTTSTERAFLDSVAQVGLERAKSLITRFEKLARL